ncbi:hypothetical protein BO71DRAFT_22928 [Aspergillus ellipticus CBS 707.79]|uniref:Uncharacterized protein n=1 Tax=Aspergillus ellipticus CBS 707.79 TaxID=1448320 RepID=A0A319DMG6_9EURO|nr:hypothetical protein BO71DRAFT_22928 [Aspergillus ellipticus CBS 707.79]
MNSRSSLKSLLHVLILPPLPLVLSLLLSPALLFLHPPPGDAPSQLQESQVFPGAKAAASQWDCRLTVHREAIGCFHTQRRTLTYPECCHPR